MGDLIFRSAKWMADAVRRREVSSVELVQAHLDRISAVNPRLNAVVEIDAEGALALARKADSSTPDGPLHGVPMSVKGAWDCKGWLNSGGTLGRKDLIANQDATVIARLRAAGAIPLCTTNLPELSMAFESDNLIYGRSNNPYNLDRTPGGSGGGGSAAIASGCSPFEIGGDLGGSIRVPAAFCGISGLKTTVGRIPLSGYFPAAFGSIGLFATSGPMARYVEDLILLLPLIAGPDGIDLAAAPVPVGDPGAIDVPSLRIAFHIGNDVSPDIDITVRKVAAALNADEETPPGFDQAIDVFSSVLGADGGEGLRILCKMCGTREVSPLYQGALDWFANYKSTGAQLANALVQRDVYRLHLNLMFQRFDVLLCPVNTSTAYAHGKTVENLKGFVYSMAHNVSGCPAAVVRCGTDPNGLPINVQLVAAPWQEHKALAVASWLEKQFGGFVPPAPL